jgi:hypothetical protein
MREKQSDEERSDSPPPLHLAEAKVFVEGQSCPRFSWESRWLKGHEYGVLLRRVEDYCVKYGLERYPLN